MTDHAALEVLPPYARKAVTFWKTNAMLPASYLKKDAQGRVVGVDLEGMEHAAWMLVRLDVDPIDALRDTYMVHGEVGFKADLQRALLARVPGYDFELLEVDDEHATARIRTPTGWKPPITKRIGDADVVTYARQNQANYRDKPRRMLEARITTELIDLYAKGVIRGLVQRTAPSAAGWYTDTGEPEAAPLGEVEPSGPPPRSVAPDGTTIPEPLREPEVADDVRAELRGRLAGLEPDAITGLAARCKALGMPNLNTVRFTRCHGALLSRLIDETAELSRPPASSYDDDPEAADHGDAGYRYDPDDGSPF
ncbi:MAG TPA: hypothetical protein VGH66_02855 [Acidimicrobiales bacterium]